MDPDAFVAAGLRLLGVALPLNGEEEILRKLYAAGGKLPEAAVRRGQAGAAKSRDVRKGRADLRRFFVNAAFEALPADLQDTPNAKASLDALEECYRSLVGAGLEPEARAEIFKSSPFKADREQLIKDLRVLGIRSRRSTRLS